MIARLALLFALLPMLFGLIATPATADPADISAASRSVVRVVLAARDGDRVVFVGHGSGFAVAPNRIVTNAHVVQIAREEPGVVIGIVPSQGDKSFGARIVAVSQGQDLALLELQDSGRLPAATLYSGPVSDSADVTAIGYPGAVDRAQGLNFDDLIRPMSPVKTRGNVSAGRASKDFDTILHTAPLASGSSGGPLVDECGRILGANSFGSLSDGNDAEFGFAVSNRELIAFLRRAGIKANLTGTPCRSAAEIESEEAERRAAAEAEAQAKERAATQRREQEEARARSRAEREVIQARENAMAIAAILLALSVVAGVAAAFLFQREQRKPAIAATVVAVLLLLGAFYAFFSRPSFTEIEDRVAAILEEENGPAEASDGSVEAAAAGDYVCTILPSRSRITVSQTEDLPFTWAEGGCVNGRTQYGRDGGNWSRIFVPNEDQTVTLSSFDPATREFVTERYLLDLEAMQAARTIRQKYSNKACTGDAAEKQDIATMIAAIRVELPNQPNERLVYKCQPEG